MKIFNQVITLALALCFTFLGHSPANAGGCRLKDVTPSKALASRYLAEMIRSKVVAIEAEMNKRGQKLNAVLVARSGESMGGFDMIKDDPSKSLQDYLDYLVDLSKAGPEGRLTDSKGRRIAPTKGNRLPGQLYLDRKLQYSHFGVLIKRDQVNPANGPQAKDWVYMVHLLAECDQDEKRYGSSEIFFQTFDQFFWDTKMLSKKVENNRALLVVPTPEIQERLYKLLHDANVGEVGMHTPKYNVAATPYRLRDPKILTNKRITDKRPPLIYQIVDQNSNQWPLEMLAAATKPIGQITNRYQAQDQLMATNYRPSLLRPTGMKESAACALKKGKIFNLTLWDATNLLNCNDQVYRNNGIIQLITVDSFVDYMSRNQFVAESVETPGALAIHEVIAPREKIEALDKLGKMLEDVDKKANPEKYSKNSRNE
jgi:Uncharacterized protein conserved in bacteria (DUF2145)